MCPLSFLEGLRRMRGVTSGRLSRDRVDAERVLLVPAEQRQGVGLLRPQVDLLVEAQVAGHPNSNAYGLRRHQGPVADPRRKPASSQR
jgi:hypothetical protein